MLRDLLLKLAKPRARGWFGRDKTVTVDEAMEAVRQWLADPATARSFAEATRMDDGLPAGPREVTRAARGVRAVAAQLVAPRR